MKKYFKFENILLLFLTIQPFFDLIYTYGNFSTLIRVIIISLFFIYTLIKYKDKKMLIFTFIYGLIMILYLYFHHKHCAQFNSLIPNNFNYSLFNEIIYLLKMTMPFLLIYIIYKNNFKKNNISLTYKIIIVLISGSIVITNILGISLSTYTNEVISANFFEWFIHPDKYLYYGLASKGLFYFANHIVIILLMLVPIMFYILTKKYNFLNSFFFFILLLSLILLGNKISTFGSYLVVISLLFIYLFHTKIISKTKINKKILFYLLITILIYPIFIHYSPALERVTTNEGTAQKYLTNDNIDNSLIDYIEKNYVDKKIPNQFINISYPYQYDPEFWYDILQETEENRINYRFLEIKMIERVIEINNNKLDKWFGIGYSRHMNIFNVEKDYLNQFYSVGIFGTMLIIFPYLFLIIYILFRIIKNKNFELNNILLSFSIFLLLIAAYFSGNLFNSLSVMIPSAYIYAFLLKNVVNGVKKY